jgi:hypothetical protein
VSKGQYAVNTVLRFLFHKRQGIFVRLRDCSFSGVTLFPVVSEM